LVSETLATMTRPAPLPIWATAADTYRHLWQYRWTFFWQLFIWAMFMWIAQLPTQLLIALVRLAGLISSMTSQGIADFALYLAISILCLLAGGGLMFLSCGRAIMFGRRPQVRDAVRPLRMGSFWRYLMLYWLIVNLVPTVAVQGLRIYFAFEGIGNWWLNSYGMLAVYWVWAVAAAPAIVLALPIAAFEPDAAPMRDGWRRLRGNRLRLAALSVVAALPIVLAETVHGYGSGQLADLISAAGWGSLLRWAVMELLMSLLNDMLSLLLILVLGTTALLAYTRLSPRFEHVARVFD
jgi:hypothetical protein